MDNKQNLEMNNNTQPSADFIEAKDFTVKQLRQVLFAGSQILPRRVAVLLLEKKRYAGKFDDLRRVLDDEGQDTRTRFAAATALGRLGTPAAREALRQKMDIPDAFLRRGIRQALDHLASSGEPGEPGEPAEGPTWGQTLAAFRTGSPGYEIPFPPAIQFVSVDASQAQTVSAEAAPARLVSGALAEIRQHLAGLNLARGNALLLRCTGREWLVLLASSKPDPRTPANLTRHKALLGVVAVRFVVELETWSPKYYILTQPGGGADRVQVLLASMRGRLSLAGTAQVKGERLEFSLRFLPEPGAIPFEVSGAYETGIVRVERVLVSRTRLPPIPLHPS